MDLMQLNRDLDLIEGVNADYALGRHRGYTDGQTEERALKAFNNASELIDAIAFLYSNYGLESDENLTEDAKELKKNVLKFIKILEEACD